MYLKLENVLKLHLIIIVFLKGIIAISFFLLCGIGELFAQKNSPEQPIFPNNTHVRFYPNPATNFITFDIKEPIERGLVLQVYSFLGRQISSVPVNGSRVTLNLSQFFRGVYVVQLRSANGKVLETHKFQVSK